MVDELGKENQAEWRNTDRLKLRLRGRPPLYEEPDGESKNGWFAGRRIIGRDTPINGGVYLGSGKREAIVVDGQKYPQELNETYSELRRMMSLPSSVRGGKSILEMVYDISGSRLGGNINEEEFNRRTQGLRFQITGRASSTWEGNIEDVKVTLNDFMRLKAGVCRHRALLAGYLLERLINEGVLKGRVSVDRNTVRGRGGHAWARYETPERRVFIIDPSLGYVGRLDKAPKTKDGWSYARPQV
ncbi:MAG: hypothetical protein Q7S03_01585 [bacterium]|nr:hypothetical protein [bacterium]